MKHVRPATFRHQELEEADRVNAITTARQAVKFAQLTVQAAKRGLAASIRDEAKQLSKQVSELAKLLDQRPPSFP